MPYYHFEPRRSFKTPRRLKKLSSIAVFAQWAYEHYCDKGDFQPVQTVDGELFTIVQYWLPYERFVTEVITYAGLRPIYKEALWRARQHQYLGPAQVQIRYGTKLKSLRRMSVLPYGELRLGYNGYFPVDDVAMFLIPEPVQPVAELLERLMGAWGFADQWDTCCICNRLARIDISSQMHPEVEFVEGEGYAHLTCLEAEHQPIQEEGGTYAQD